MLRPSPTSSSSSGGSGGGGGGGGGTALATFRIRFGRGMNRANVPSALRNVGWTPLQWNTWCDAYEQVLVTQYKPHVHVVYAILAVATFLGTVLIALAARRSTGWDRRYFMGPTLLFFSVLVATLRTTFVQQKTIRSLQELCETYNSNHRNSDDNATDAEQQQQQQTFEWIVTQDYTRIIDIWSSNNPQQANSYIIREYYLKIRLKKSRNDKKNYDNELPAVPTMISSSLPSWDDNDSTNSTVACSNNNKKKKSIKQRLQELNAVKDELDDDEYRRKRQEILDMI